MEILQKYFPELSPRQLQRFGRLQELYLSWNEKINIVSRKDIDHLYERHVLHSLAIAKFISFKESTNVIDVGTGGGFPGIPLAIMFPKVHFQLVDSIGKKIKVVHALINELELDNASTRQIRVEELTGSFDFIVSRAVASMETIFHWTKNRVTLTQQNEKPNGWILLKGGDLREEIKHLNKTVEQVPVSLYFEEEFFNEKFIVYFKR